jgi:competence protein ComEC
MSMRVRISLAILLAWGLCGAVQADFRVQTMDVGYGECYLLEEWDGGRRRWASLVDAGTVEAAPVVLNALKKAGVRRLDDVFLTHGHPNHTGALSAIIRSIQVGRLYWRGTAGPEEPMAPLLDQLNRNKIETITATTSLPPLRRGAVTFDILNPATPEPDPHAGGLVILFTYGATSFLFAGDVSPARQEKLWPLIQHRVRERGATLQGITWPHHGDTLATSWEAAMTNIPWIILSTGPNPHGLPRAAHYPALLRNAVRTDTKGRFRLVSDEKQIVLQ